MLDLEQLILVPMQPRQPLDGPILAVRVEDLGEKEALLAARAADGFFTIPHFDNYAAVLIELDQVSEPALSEALLDAWLLTFRSRRRGDCGSVAAACAKAAVTTNASSIKAMNLIPRNSKSMHYSQQEQTTW